GRRSAGRCRSCASQGACPRGAVRSGRQDRGQRDAAPPTARPGAAEMSRLPAFATLLFAALMAAQASAAGETAKDPDLSRVSGQLAQLDADPSLGQLGDVDRLKAHQALDELAQTSPHSLDR